MENELTSNLHSLNSPAINYTKDIQLCFQLMTFWSSVTKLINLSSYANEPAPNLTPSLQGTDKENLIFYSVDTDLIHIFHTHDLS